MADTRKLRVTGFGLRVTKTAFFAAAIAFLVPAALFAYKISGMDIRDANGKVIRAVAVNAPGLLTLDEKQAVETLEALGKKGVVYVRILASFNGGSAYAFQTAPGRYNNEMFLKLDRVIAAAGKSGQKLIIALADGNNEFGGNEVYAGWTGGSNEEIFFKDRISKEWFKKYMNEFLSRKNTVTAAAYSADPAIFSWDLCNAAGSSVDPDGTVMYDWVSEMASYVKSGDKSHLVSVNLKRAFDAGKINNYDIALLPGLDFVTFTKDGSESAAETVTGYGANAGKPVAVIIPETDADIKAAAAEFARSGASFIFFNQKALDDEKTSAEFSEAILKTDLNAARAPGPAVTDSISVITSESAEIKVSAPEKTTIQIIYGTSEPLKNTAEGAGTIKITGLKPGTKYLYRVKALREKGFVSPVKSFTTKSLVRLKSIPFAMSNNFIKAKDGAFYDGSKKYRYMGANNYYIRHVSRELCDEIFREAAAVGIKVIRIGSNGEAESMDSIDKRSVNRFFRIGPDYFNEAAYKEFDYVLDSAARHGVRVIIHFTDNWEYYGGCKVYVKWAGFSNKNLFWTDPKVKEYYKQTIDKIVDRKNTVNGKLYRNDPAIFAYDLLNEPRDEDDPTGRTLAAWVDEMSAYIKSKDPNHMVTTGMEGFFLKSDGTHYSGSDFVLCQQPMNIDFSTFHIYPASQYNNFSPTTTAWMLANFVKIGHEKTGKPVVMEEYGIPNNNPDFPKAKWIKDMTEGFFNDGGDGANYWFFIDPSYPSGDGNEVNYKQTEYMNTFIKVANELNKGGY